MSVFQKKIGSKIGTYYIVASAQGLQGIFWRAPHLPEIGREKNEAREHIDQAEFQLDEYLAGKRRKFDLTLHVKGTVFQQKVWRELAKIPYGETRSYRDIAVALNDRNACRAVGSANGRNPISIVVPCHRVIASGGSMGGYAGGLAVKERLLSLERRVKLQTA